MTALSFAGAGKTFENGYAALENLTFSVEQGEFVSLVGPSGCGKSTLLNLAAGLMAPSAGMVESFGQRVQGVNPRAAYLFQQDTLLPWKTALDNAALGLMFRRSGDARARAEQWLSRVGLSAFAHQYPHQMSGGMRKRVSLAQCLAVGPDLLLMDEPFSALDVHTRQRMEQELLDLWQETRPAIVFVTHDLEEAIALSDRVLLLSAGPASRVIGSYAIPLARPRMLLDIRTDAMFIELHRAIWQDLRNEVIQTHAR